MLDSVCVFNVHLNRRHMGPLQRKYGKTTPRSCSILPKKMSVKSQGATEKVVMDTSESPGVEEDSLEHPWKGDSSIIRPGSMRPNCSFRTGDSDWMTTQTISDGGLWIS